MAFNFAPEISGEYGGAENDTVAGTCCVRK